MMKNRCFFKGEVPWILAHPGQDHQPIRGRMKACAMLEHRNRALKMNLNKEEGSIETAPDDPAADMKFLMADRPLARNLRQPAFFAWQKPFPEETPAQSKRKFIREIDRTLKYFEEHPDYRSKHPDFGLTNRVGVEQLHYQHFNHHLRQFGLVAL